MRGYGLQQRDSAGRVWRISIYTGQKDAAGKRQRYTETFHGSARDANKRAQAVAAAQDKGLTLPTSGTTIQHVLDAWLAVVRTKRSDRTIEDYETTVKRHLGPAFGSLKPRQLTAPRIQTFYSDSLETHSPTTVLKWHHALHAALRFGLRQGMLAVNPCDLVDPPSKAQPEMQVWLPQELDSFMASAESSYYYPIFYTAVSSGLRQGELLGLRWRDVDTVLCTISVNRSLSRRRGLINFKEPKSRRSRRLVAMTPKLGLFLQQYHRSRSALYAHIAKALGPDELVFTSIDFEPLHGSVVSHAFDREITKAKVSRIRFHDLRHTFATLGLLQGADPKTISEALGHSSVAFTLDTYAHILSGMQETMMSRINNVVPSGVAPSYLRDFTPN